MPATWQSGGLIQVPASGNSSYSTTFPATENPMVDDGGWKQGATDGGLWTNIRTAGGTPGIASATMFQFVGGAYNDSLACRAVWNGADYTIQATCRNNGGTTAGLENELLGRMSITNGNVTGYECDIVSQNGPVPNVNLVRLNPGGNTGGSGVNYDVIATGVAVGTINEGDVWKFIFTGTLCAIKCNNVLIPLTLNGWGGGISTTSFNLQGFASAIGGAYRSTGAPGFGFWNQSGGLSNNLGWHDWSAA